ncbi:MAG: hypothetical protein ABIN80_24230 [Dyadobacter sp.]|uniref:hypothetical protein n=1 Tax=Dyadobacter sp. TaxID=1914288 RepID=UPI003262F0AB
MTHSLTAFDTAISTRISWSVRIADFLKSFAKSVSDKISAHILTDINDRTAFFESQLNLIPDMSVSDAEQRIAMLRKILPSMEKLDAAITKFNHPNISQSFKLQKKALFKLEAKLHQVINADSDIIETPEYLKSGITDLGLESLPTQL